MLQELQEEAMLSAVVVEAWSVVVVVVLFMAVHHV